MPRFRTAYRTPARSAPPVSIGQAAVAAAAALPAAAPAKKKRKKRKLPKGFLAQQKRPFGAKAAAPAAKAAPRRMARKQSTPSRGTVPLGNQPNTVPQPSRRGG